MKPLIFPATLVTVLKAMPTQMGKVRMTNTINRIRLSLVLALVAVVMTATYGSGGPPSVSAQTDTTAPTISSIAITSDPDDDTLIDGWTFDSGV